MGKSDYKININHLEQKHGIARLERDGFSREQIMKTMYKETQGMKKTDRTKLVKELFNRMEK